MKKLIFLTISFILAALTVTVGYSSDTKHHKTALPDAESYNAHFGDMDANDDDLVNWEEFKAHFQHAKPEVFNAIDLNQDGSIDHDEWHAFKEAHALKHKE